MEKTLYQVKVYDRTNSTLKETISPKTLTSDMSFSANLDGGLGEQQLELQEGINSMKYAYGDIIKITMFNEKEKQGRTIFMGYVTKIGRKQTRTRQLINLTCLGVASLLTEQAISQNLTGLTAGGAVKAMVDSYNASYGNIFNYVMGTTIIDGPSMGSGSVSGKYLDNMKSLANRCKYNLFIDGNGTVWFKPTSTTADHFLTNQKDVEEIEINEDLEGVVNSATMTDLDFNNSTYTDAVSIAQYGKKHYSGKSDSRGASYLASYVQSYVEERKDPKKETKIVVNRNYYLESLKPGDTIKVRNFDYVGINNVKIIKLSYTPDKCVLNLDKYTSFGQEVIQN